MKGMCLLSIEKDQNHKPEEINQLLRVSTRNYFICRLEPETLSKNTSYIKRSKLGSQQDKGHMTTHIHQRTILKIFCPEYQKNAADLEQKDNKNIHLPEFSN